MDLPKEDQIPKGSHSAETASLGQKPYGKSHQQGDDQGGVHRSRTLGTIEKDTVFCLSLDRWKDEHQYEKT